MKILLLHNNPTQCRSTFYSFSDGLATSTGLKYMLNTAYNYRHIYFNNAIMKTHVTITHGAKETAKTYKWMDGCT